MVSSTRQCSWGPWRGVHAPAQRLNVKQGRLSTPLGTQPQRCCLLPALPLDSAPLGLPPQEAAAAGMSASALIRPEALDESRIEDLIGQHLQHNLEILPEQVGGLPVVLVVGGLACCRWGLLWCCWVGA